MASLYHCKKVSLRNPIIAVKWESFENSMINQAMDATLFNCFLVDSVNSRLASA